MIPGVLPKPVNFNLVETESEVEYIWHSVAPLIKLALDESQPGWTLKDVQAACYSMHCQLWLPVQGALILGVVVSQIKVYGDVKLLELFIISGQDLDEWFATGISKLEAFAMIQGCSAIDVSGPRAWVRMLATRGYKEITTVVRLNLQPMGSSH